LHEQIVQLEHLTRYQVRQEVEIEASAWFVHEGVATLLELFQRAFPEAIPDVLAFLCQQLEYYPPAGENPDPDGFEAFIAKKSAAKRKMEGNCSDNDREKGTSRKRRWLQKKVVEDEMDVDTDVLGRDRSASWESFPEVAIETEWPAGLRMTNSPLSDFEGVAGPSGLSTEEKEKTPVEMEIEDVAGPSGDPNANAKPVENWSRWRRSRSTSTSPDTRSWKSRRGCRHSRSSRVHRPKNKRSR
jgi:hypothetical protein